MNASAFLVRSFRLTIAAIAAVIISACSEPLGSGTIGPSTFPSQVTVPLAGHSVAARRGIATFPLDDGSLQLTISEGTNSVGTIVGTYSGTSSNPIPGRATATLAVEISKTTGVASGITFVKAEGSGAFVDEGDFTLTLSFATAQGKTFAVKLRGTSTLSCTDEQLIQVTMRGTGSDPRIGNVDVLLQHEVGNTGCFE